MKIEDNCFSLLYSASDNSTGKLKLFHLFSDNYLLNAEGSKILTAYGPGVELFAGEWLNDTIQKQNIKNSYHIN
ncbi:hypothetical protein [Arcticibacter sp. MXS-1]|uniref:hypothetical protein n=1 Tax=Arcticibacter sp. MXS-1 TaxID=3341726 RepID=UPI0035A8D526